MILDLHIHSCYSFDSYLTPQKIISISKSIGLSGIAITDHNTIKGSVAAKKINQDKDFLVIISSEIWTDRGDIIGLFLNEEIKSRDSLEVIAEIHAQGGLVVLPHPYRGHKLTDELISSVDLIEGFNSRTSLEDNNKAKKLAKKFNKPMIVGSDAHFRYEIGASKVLTRSASVRKELLKGKLKFETELTPRYMMDASQVIKSLKERKYSKLPMRIAYLVMNMLRRR